MGINYENAKAIYRIYRLERRKTQQTTKLQLFSVKMRHKSTLGLRRSNFDFDSSAEVDQAHKQSFYAEELGGNLLTTPYGKHTQVLFAFDRQSELRRQLFEKNKTHGNMKEPFLGENLSTSQQAA